MLASALRYLPPTSTLIRANTLPADDHKASPLVIKPLIPAQRKHHIVITSNPELGIWPPAQRRSVLPTANDCATLSAALAKMRRFFLNSRQLSVGQRGNDPPPQPQEDSREPWIFPFGKNYSDWRQHLGAIIDDRPLLKPTGYSEAGNVLENLPQILHASCALQSAAQLSVDERAALLGVSFGTTACRNHDSSHLMPGDHILMFMAQIAQACLVYRELLLLKNAVLPGHLKSSAAPEWVLPLPKSLQTCVLKKLEAIHDITVDAAHIGHLDQGQPLAPERLEMLETFLAMQDLLALENEIVALCTPHASHPVCATFLQHRLGVFAGEASVSAKALPGLAQTPMPDLPVMPVETLRLHDVLREIAAIHQSYPDVRTLTLTDFSSIDQTIALRGLLEQHDLKNISIIARLDNTVAIDGFLRQAQAFKDHDIAVMLDLGSLQQASGTALAMIDCYRVAEQARQHGLTVSHSAGASLRRGGTGFSDYLATRFATESFFQGYGSQDKGQPAPYRHTLQSTQADIQLGNKTLAQRFLQSGQFQDFRLDATATPTTAHINKAREIFQPLIEAELAMRDSDLQHNPLARLYEDYPVIATLRGLNHFSGSSQETAEVHTDAEQPWRSVPKHLYAGQASQTDIVIEVFGLGTAWVGQHLRAGNPVTYLIPLIQQTRQALRDGNPVVQAIVLRLALQAASLHFPSQNQRRWEAANFSADIIKELHASNNELQNYLLQVRYSLSNNAELRLCMVEYLGLDPRKLPDDQRLTAIENQLDLALAAAVETIVSTRQFMQTSFLKTSQRQTLANKTRDSLSQWAVNLGGIKS